jgi:Arf-GAP/SH3 domain/ANK repeat/PH domain-containing protein
MMLISRFWIVLDQGKLSEYSNWKQRLDLHMEPIDLRMASVREARNAERRFCFEVITPSYKRVYQATSEEDMMNWIYSINNALQSAVEGRGIHQEHQKASSPVEGSNRRDIGSILTGKSSSYTNHSREASNSSGIFRRTTVGSRPIFIRSSSNSFEEHPDKLLQIVRDADQSNCWCADCGSGIKTEWVSINLGIVLCIECSGIHRSLGTHVSKIRSLTLDTNAFTTDIVELLLQIGNRKSNLVWEATLTSLSVSPDAVPRPPKPSPQASREVRLHFITAKYAQRLFVQALSPTLSRYSTPDETLLASIKKNDIQNILYALALKANPNATDKSRNTHAVFLALAAADPAQPGAPPGDVNVAGGKGKAVAFPAAELLVQNGADIPSNPPAFPLSKNAQLYIEQKAARTATPSGGNGVDVVRALPSIGENSGHIPSHSQSARERLQKRVSAGGRMGRTERP